MHVLVGIEGSDESMKTLRKTIERTTAVGDTLTVAVISNPQAERSRQEVIGIAEDAIDEADIDASVIELDGDPGSALVEHAEREGFDQLVIGGGTESPMGKIRLGPITEFVLLNATVTVKLIR